MAGLADPHCPTQHELSNRAIRITIAGQTLFYSGDGRPTADSIALMAGAGLAFWRTGRRRTLVSPSTGRNAAKPDVAGLADPHCPTQHELSNRAIRITIAGQTLFTAAMADRPPTR